jgi:hypothetical protein
MACDSYIQKISSFLSRLKEIKEVYNLSMRQKRLTLNVKRKRLEARRRIFSGDGVVGGKEGNSGGGVAG